MEDLRQRIASGTPKVGETLFISIDGHGGSGKSSLAKFLGQKLGAEIIHTDDFAGWEGPPNWWADVIDSVFKPISLGVTSLTYQPANWWENNRSAPVENQPVTSVMILEGVSSSRHEFADFISVRIFVDTPKEVCLRRGIERDKATGKSEAELLGIWQGWMADEELYFSQAHPKQNADIVIDGAKPFDRQFIF